MVPWPSIVQLPYLPRLGAEKLNTQLAAPGACSVLRLFNCQRNLGIWVTQPGSWISFSTANFTNFLSFSVLRKRAEAGRDCAAESSHKLCPVSQTRCGFVDSKGEMKLLPWIQWAVLLAKLLAACSWCSQHHCHPFVISLNHPGKVWWWDNGTKSALVFDVPGGGMKKGLSLSFYPNWWFSYDLESAEVGRKNGNAVWRWNSCLGCSQVYYKYYSKVQLQKPLNCLASLEIWMLPPLKLWLDNRNNIDKCHLCFLSLLSIRA